MRILRTGDSPFFSEEENLAPRRVCIFAFSQLTLCHVVSVTSHSHPLLFHTDLQPDIRLLQAYCLSSTSVLSQAFPTNSNARAAQHTAEPQQDPRPFLAFITAIARHPRHHQRTEESLCSLKWSRNVLLPAPLRPKTRHMQRHSTTVPTFADSPGMRPQVDPRSISTDSDSATRRVTTAPCAQVLAQQCEPASTENQTVVAPEQAEGSSATRTTLLEASDFEAVPTHAKSESSPASIANVCAHVHSGDANSARTPAASRKSHRVPSVSHECSRPVRRRARISRFCKDDSAPSVGSIKCRRASK